MVKEITWPDYTKMLTGKPRDYQTEAIQAWFTNSCKGVFQMATGTGKTFTSIAALGYLTQKLTSRGTSALVVIVCPYIHVVDQWLESLSSQSMFATAAYEARELWQADLQDKTARLNAQPGRVEYVVTTIATFKTKSFQKVIKNLYASDLVFVADEVHHFGAASLSSFLPSKAKYRLGLSATPDRHKDIQGTEKIMNYFAGVVYSLDIKTAIAKGILTQYDYLPKVCILNSEETAYYAEITESIGVILKGREFSELSPRETEKVGMLLRLRSAVLGTSFDKQQKFLIDFKSNAHLKDQLAYCSQGGSPINPEMGKHIDYVQDNLMDLGVQTAKYDALTPRNDRLRILEAFKSGEIDVILSMKCLDEAVDIPSATICYFLSSGTNPREFIQRRGRVLRRHKGKEKAIVYDYITVPMLVDNAAFLEVERSILIRELERASELAEAALNRDEALKVLESIKIGE